MLCHGKSSNFFELGNQVNSLRGDVPPLNPEFFGYNYEEVRNFHKFSEQYDPTLVARDEEHPNDEEGNPYVVPSENPYDFNTSNLYNIDQRLQTLNQSLMGVDVVIPPAADGDLLSNISGILECPQEKIVESITVMKDGFEESFVTRP